MYSILPPYHARKLLQITQTGRKFSIQPSENEGQELLPLYSSDISLENVFVRKLELECPLHRAQDRQWHRVYATLQGTALILHKYESSGYFSSWASETRRLDIAIGKKKGHLLKSYNLQYADVGIAADYYKYVAQLMYKTILNIYIGNDT